MRIQFLAWFTDGAEPIEGRDDEVPECCFWSTGGGPLSCLVKHHNFEALLPVHDIVLHVAVLVVEAQPSQVLALITIKTPHKA